MKKLKVMAIMLAGAFILMQTPVFAASPWTEGQDYQAKVGKKLAFGLRNALFGWTELPAALKQAHDEKGNAVLGLGQGLIDATVDTVGGLIHTATFFLPQVDMPIPNNGVDVDFP